MNEDIRMLERRVPSSDGDHELVGRVYLPDGDAKGLFQVVHGMTEYTGRYDRFMREIAAAGYICFGCDHLGHGLTARDKSELGFIAHKDGWERLVDDVDRFASDVRAEYGEGLPYYLMGHSMGSFIVRLAAAKFDRHDKLVVMGTGGPNGAAGAGIALSKVIKAFCGERHFSKLVYALAFGSYNKRFKDEDDYLSWLTNDKEVREANKKDEFCSFVFTVSAMIDLISLQKNSNKKTWAAAMNKEKPVLLVSGSDDPVGDYGKGPSTVRDMLAAEGVPVELKIYDGYRHEILNDASHDEVTSDILAFVGE